MNTKHSIEDLNKLYNEGDDCDTDLFPEMKSNVMLVIGDHYSKMSGRLANRIRDTKELDKEQRLRLTKNHIQKIAKTYVNNITSQAPGVSVSAKSDKELQDQKAAELHNAIWQDIKVRLKFNKKIREFAEDFIYIGEAWCKIFWDPTAGQMMGFKPQVDEEGQPVMDEEGGYAKGEPIFSGDLVFDRIHGFNILRPREARSFEDCKFVIIRKMEDKQKMKQMFPDGDERQKFVDDSSGQIFHIFDTTNGSYRKSENEVLIREYFFRPCTQYPNGYFYIATEGGILFEGELPGGVFPIAHVGFDEIPTSPRSRSIIKQLRPYQAEINRAASKIAEHQITLGDDKLLIQDGTKIAHGGSVPGVRAIKFTGMTPTLLQGRTGEQYVGYMNSQIAEMYQVANIQEDSEEKIMQSDPMTLLYRSIKNKKKFTLYSDKFEDFYVCIVEIALRLAKLHYPEDKIVPAVSKKEIVNIPEFKASDDISYQIIVDKQTDDVESKMGKHIAMSQMIQYVGGKLPDVALGKILRMSPYTNDEQALDDLTLDYDAATNDILALDRGENPPVMPSDNHEYMMRRLASRMRMADFRTMDPMIQQNYQKKHAAHAQAKAKADQALLAAKSEFIPTGGYMVVVDMYVTDPKDPMKTKRARLPYEAVSWLIKKLEAQGSSLSALEKSDSYTRQVVAQQMTAGGKQGAPMQPGGMQRPGMPGPAMPGMAPRPAAPQQQPPRQIPPQVPPQQFSARTQ